MYLVNKPVLLRLLLTHQMKLQLFTSGLSTLLSVVILYSHTFLLNSHAIQWTSQNTSHPDHVCDHHLVASHM